VRIEAVHPGELGAPEGAAWERLIAANPNLASPYYSLGYAKAVGAARPDARVAVIEDGGAIQGFLCVQRAGGMAGMALGAPLSDYQGLVAASDDLRPDGRLLCRALRVGRIDFTHLPATQAGMTSQFRGANPSWVANVVDGAAAYLAQMRQKRQETLRQQDRKRRKMEREVEGLTFAIEQGDATHLEALLEWKTEQCRRTGQPLVWAAPWVRRTVHAAFEAQDPAFRGMLFTLKSGEKLAAAHYALVNGHVMHAWLLSHDPSFEAYSPGVLLTRYMVEWAANNGYAAVDFGIGDYRYKREFGEPLGALGWGYIGRPSVAAVWRSMEFTGRSLLERAPFGAIAEAPGKVMRRLDVMRGLAAPNS
jgi:CelD/BcsL family acetyltransferase involved in cellulose biosynthesis